MDLILFDIIGFILRKSYFFLRYRKKAKRKEKERQFLNRDNTPSMPLIIPAILLLVTIGSLLLLAIGRTVYGLINGNPIY